MQKLISVPTRLQKVISAHISENGLKKTSETFNLVEKTILRLAAGVPVSPGTVALVDAALARLKTRAVA